MPSALLLPGQNFSGNCVCDLESLNKKCLLAAALGGDQQRRDSIDQQNESVLDVSNTHDTRSKTFQMFFSRLVL